MSDLALAPHSILSVRHQHWWHFPALAHRRVEFVTCSSRVSQTNQLPGSLIHWVCSPTSQTKNRLMEMPSHRTLGMIVKGTTGLLASSSSAVRKHSVAASSLPWACSTSPRLFQTSWAVEFTWTASLRIFSAKLKRPSWWSIRACKKTKGKWLRLASRAFLKLKQGHCSEIKVGSSWVPSVILCNFLFYFFNLRKEMTCCRTGVSYSTPTSQSGFGQETKTK